MINPSKAHSLDLATNKSLRTSVQCINTKPSIESQTQNPVSFTQYKTGTTS